MEGARAAFEAMPLRTTASYNALLAGYFRNNLPDAALRVFHRMPSRDLASYNALISGFSLRRHTLPDAAAALATIPYPPSVVSFTSLLRGYVRHGLLADAIQLFRQMPERNHISYTVLLGYFLDAGRVDEARALFDEMPGKDVVAWTAMLSGYCQAGRIAEARVLFDEMPKKNVVSWTAMVSGYAQNGQVNLARKLFEVMPEHNEVSWTAMLFGYIQAGRVEDAEELFNAMPEHPLPACNAMIVGFGQRGMVDAAKSVFERMRKRDDGTWSAIIKAYERNEFLMEALSTFREMLHDGIRPNYPSVISILTVCAALAVLDYGREVHAAMLRCSFDKDVFTVSALITMYIKCGNLDKAKKVFNMFEPKDVVMWNSMITGYAQHGLGEEALRIFDDMRLAGMVPDRITYIGALTACSYTGKVKEGKDIFNSMDTNSASRPGAEHYSCMVDLLGQAGCLEEALELIKTMPVEPDAVIWGALMGACRMHKNAEIAELHGNHADAGRGLTRRELLHRMAVRSKARAARLLSGGGGGGGGGGAPASARVDPGAYTGVVPDTEYLVHLAIGTPPQPVQLILDTGSDLNWGNRTCVYVCAYADNSITTGSLDADTFTFAAGDSSGEASVPGLAFGCGLFNNGIFTSNETGIAGFGRGALSLPSQLKVDNFSHCFTAITGSEPSTILLGLPADLYGGAVQSTPLVQNFSSLTAYYLSLKGITVGETRLPIPESTFALRQDGTGGTVIDSGTGMTSLPRDAYKLVRDAFVAQARLPVDNATSSQLSQLCFSAPRRATPDDVPRLALHFEGATLELPRENYMFDLEDAGGGGFTCLAVNAGDDLTVIGNYQQQNLHVLYDLIGNTLYFVPAQCNRL
ncbi:pentatricopeptide repeat-containing protein [Panicum miliaceum]|uniref:Pentatricopeptide repeat-containing protein n=1 Tax=Panicum miliaceum TaxID=4540 RepID=A0A3L6TGA7_PANMI|nr:pentatricopeptide repeat-containing protein [Panicum miliaceum]